MRTVRYSAPKILEQPSRRVDSLVLNPKTLGHDSFAPSMLLFGSVPGVQRTMNFASDMGGNCFLKDSCLRLAIAS